MSDHSPVKSQQEVLDEFYRELMLVGKQVLAEGLRYGYGYSQLEIKFANGIPSVMILSHTESRKYKSDEDGRAAAHSAIDAVTEKGSQTFTIVREDGGTIKRVLIDEYTTHMLQ